MQRSVWLKSASAVIYTTTQRSHSKSQSDAWALLCKSSNIWKNERQKIASKGCYKPELLISSHCWTQKWLTVTFAVIIYYSTYHHGDSVHTLHAQYSGSVEEYFSDSPLFCAWTFPTVSMNPQIHVWAAEGDIWPEFSVHSVGAGLHIGTAHHWHKRRSCGELLNRIICRTDNCEQSLQRIPVTKLDYVLPWSRVC